MYRTRLMTSSRTPITATTDTTAVSVFFVSPWKTASSSASSATWSLLATASIGSELSSSISSPFDSGTAIGQDHREVRHRQRPVGPIVPALDPSLRAQHVGYAPRLSGRNSLARLHEELRRQPVRNRHVEQSLELLFRHRDVDLECRRAAPIAVAGSIDEHQRSDRPAILARPVALLLANAQHARQRLEPSTGFELDHLSGASHHFHHDNAFLGLLDDEPDLGRLESDDGHGLAVVRRAVAKPALDLSRIAFVASIRRRRTQRARVRTRGYSGATACNHNRFRAHAVIRVQRVPEDEMSSRCRQ